MSNLFEEKAEKDGRYAIAYALLELTHYMRDFNFGTSTQHPGTLEKIGMELERLAKAIEGLERGGR